MSCWSDMAAHTAGGLPAASPGDDPTLPQPGRERESTELRAFLDDRRHRSSMGRLTVGVGVV